VASGTGGESLPLQGSATILMFGLWLGRGDEIDYLRKRSPRKQRSAIGQPSWSVSLSARIPAQGCHSRLSKTARIVLEQP
jgi:hypothetical protein